MATINWLREKPDFALAKAQGKKVLLLVGSKCCDSTLFMRDTVCELVSPVNIKGLIERHFVPWYGGTRYEVKGCVGDPITTDWNEYAPYGSFQMPMIVVVDPATNKSLYQSFSITPRVSADASQFDNQLFFSILSQYVTGDIVIPPVVPPVACTCTLSPTSSPLFKPSPTHTAMGDVGSKGTVTVTTSSSSCPWTATSNASWITITAGSMGTGNGTVSYSVSENTGGTRTGTMTIGGQTFTITQDGVASPIVPPVTPSVIKTTLYFPHATIIDGWQTEICVINSSNQSSMGSLKLYNEKGSLTGEALLTLPAFGRKQILVNTDFSGKVVDYAVFSTESASAQGYVIFWRPGEYSSALAAVGEGKTFGVFAKIEKLGGWTGIAFINTEAAPASVTLTTYTNAGIVVETKVLAVAANSKIVNNIEKLFTGDISQATYVTYQADRKVAGFELLGSADNRTLDGLNAL